MSQLEPDVKKLSLEEFSDFLKASSALYEKAISQLSVLDDLLESTIDERENLTGQMIEKHFSSIFTATEPLPSLIENILTAIHDNEDLYEVEEWSAFHRALDRTLNHYKSEIYGQKRLAQEVKDDLKKPEAVFALEDKISQLSVEKDLLDTEVRNLRDQWNKYPAVFRDIYLECRSYNEKEAVFFGEHVYKIAADTITLNYYTGPKTDKRKSFITKIDSLLERARKNSGYASLTLEELASHLKATETLAQNKKQASDRYNIISDELSQEKHKLHRINRARSCLKGATKELLQDLAQNAISVCTQSAPSIHADLLRKTQYEALSSLCGDQILLVQQLQASLEEITNTFKENGFNQLQAVYHEVIRPAQEGINGLHHSITFDHRKTQQPAHNALILSALIVLTTVDAIKLMNSTEAGIQRSTDLMEALPQHRFTLEMIFNQSSNHQPDPAVLSQACEIIKQSHDLSMRWKASDNDLGASTKMILDDIVEPLKQLNKQEVEKQQARAEAESLYKKRHSRLNRLLKNL